MDEGKEESERKTPSVKSRACRLLARQEELYGGQTGIFCTVDVHMDVVRKEGPYLAIRLPYTPFY